MAHPNFSELENIFYCWRCGDPIEWQVDVCEGCRAENDWNWPEPEKNGEEMGEGA